MRTFVQLGNDPRSTGGRDYRDPRSTHRHGIRKIFQAFRYNRTLSSSSLTTTVGREAVEAHTLPLPPLISRRPSFSVGERAGRPVPRFARTKGSPGSSARAESARSRAPFLSSAACKCARCNVAAFAAAAPTCCCLVRAAPTRWPRAASNIRFPVTDNRRCSSGICRFAHLTVYVSRDVCMKRISAITYDMCNS